MPKILPPIDPTRLADQYTGGMSLRDLSYFYGVSISTMRSRVLEVTPLRAVGKHQKKKYAYLELDEEGDYVNLGLVERIKDLHFNDGKNVYEIQELTGIHREDVDIVIQQEIYNQMPVDERIWGKEPVQRYCEVCGEPLPLGCRNKTCKAECATRLRDYTKKQNMRMQALERAKENLARLLELNRANST